MRFLGIYCLSFLALVSCKSSNDPVSSNDLIPLKVGNEWDYEIQQFDSTGGEVNFTTDTMRIDLDSVISGEIWYHLTHTSDNTILQDFYTNRNSGYWQYLVTGASIKYKYPSAPGDIYDTINSAVISLSNYGRFYWKVIGTNISLSVSGVNYNCYHYQWLSDLYSKSSNVLISRDTIEDAFVSPSIGLVKLIQFPLSGSINNSGSKFTFVTELKKYTLK